MSDHNYEIKTKMMIIKIEINYKVKIEIPSHIYDIIKPEIKSKLWKKKKGHSLNIKIDIITSQSNLWVIITTKLYIWQKHLSYYN